MQETIPGVNVITAVKILAIQMVQLSSKGTPRNPVVRACYEKRKAEGKTSQQALICISRRLISIIYEMLKNGTEYRMPVVENAGENGKYMVEFQADARVGFGKCIHFLG